jgi:isopentenyldiphosphate isomerase
MVERINIFDSNHQLIGTATKKEAHEKGLYHEVFGCVLIDSTKNTIYLQYKNSSHNDLSSVDKIDISVGGHLKSDETKEDGVREIKEEANIDVRYEDLIFLEERKIDKFINDNYIIREFDYLYLYDNHFDLKELKSNDDEVKYYIEFDINELEDFLNNKTDKIVGKTINGEEEFYLKDFIEGYLEDDHLYLKLINYIKEYMKN